ncbi:MAG TPA: winged helix-turn-helix domain-containing protein [Candidatus Bathyarchaeia archaeon]|nr:winged helix-turn-helix domain-containing protein [Candidatus Bathyarchaeia archaeon]
MSGSEEETYSAMFSSLRHPARRKILRMLSEKSMTFSEILDKLEIPGSQLTYHLENLGELVVKKEDGKYKLSSFGEAAIVIMKRAEEAPTVQKKDFSSLPLRWKSLYAIFIIGIVILASISYGQYASYNQLSKDYSNLGASFEKVQTQNQQLLSGSASADEAMTIIKNVFQIDVTKYQVTLLSDTVEPAAGLEGVTEEVLTYSLVNNASNINLVLTFTNGNFSLFQLKVIEGVTAFTPIYTQHQPTDFFAAVSEIITRYESIDNASYLNQISQLLSVANETQQDQTLGNVKLEISINGENAQFSLLYTENNVDFAAKSLQIVFENGILTSFSDDWSLYSIGSTQVNVSQNQAIQIARDAASTFTWNANGVQISNFTVLQEPASALFYCFPRSGLSLFPYWFITLYLDKVYPGGVNSIGVGIWADTGQVANIQTLSS